jgi:feruloyl esterase
MTRSRGRSVERAVGLCGLLFALGAATDAARAQSLPPARPGGFAGDCASLAATLSGLADTRITAATTVPAGTVRVGGTPVVEHCLVTGLMRERTSAVDGNRYAIGFEMRLPKAWNGRFLHQGNGGADGNVVPATGSTGGGPVTHALQQGFAVLSSDAGHGAAQNLAFGLDPQARLDYGYQAVGTLTPMAKTAIQRVYGRGPDRSYFAGCSNGGRHTLIAASRYADEYDGFLAGSPGYNLPKAAVANIFGAQRYASVASNPADLSTGFTPAERATVSASVLARCDALDGAADGLIQDVAACQATFDLTRDVPTCTGARDGSCLSPAQKTAIGDIFKGTTTPTGAPVYASFPYDAGHGSRGIAFWEFIAPLQLDSGAVGHVFKVPPEPVAGFNGSAFALGADIGALAAQLGATNATYRESSLSFMTPPDVGNLDTVKRRGGKVMVYHGVSDPIFSWHDTVAWWNAVRVRHGSDPSDFARVYPIPGMDHCAGGPSTDQFDMLSALVAWVEQGAAPDRVIAQARGAGNPGGANPEVPATWSPARTRPLCAYPKVARYDGRGSLEEAGSFSCR